MGYTAPTTRATSNLITAAIWNTDLVDNITFLANPPSVELVQAAAQSIPNSTETVITFPTEVNDTNGMHDTVTNTGRITIQTAGVYVVTGLVAFVAGGASGAREGFIRLNATGAYLAMANQVSASGSYLSLACQHKFIVGDFVELRANQVSGGALNTFFSSPTISCRFAAQWVGLG